MSKIKQLTGWGLYENKKVVEFKDWYIHTVKFTDECGLSYYKYCNCRSTYNCRIMPWKDKNSRGRKFETRCFTTEKEAFAFAKDLINKIEN